MITSKYITGIPHPSFDTVVSAALDYHIRGGGKDMKIGIENLNGEIYRIVTTTGMGAYMHAVNQLHEIGFTDLLSNSLVAVDGFDSRFIPTSHIGNDSLNNEIELNDAATEILNSLNSFQNVTETERTAIVLSRVGQGIFREQVVAHWKACAVTNARCVRLLKASHIKPWRDSSNLERLDSSNGILLAPNIDSAFDAGYISFDKNGKILISDSLSTEAANQLHITAKLQMNPYLLNAEHKKYLSYHRTNIYIV